MADCLFFLFSPRRFDMADILHDKSRKRLGERQKNQHLYFLQLVGRGPDDELGRLRRAPVRASAGRIPARAKSSCPPAHSYNPVYIHLSTGVPGVPVYWYFSGS